MEGASRDCELSSRKAEGNEKSQGPIKGRRSQRKTASREEEKKKILYRRQTEKRVITCSKKRGTCRKGKGAMNTEDSLDKISTRKWVTG